MPESEVVQATARCIMFLLYTLGVGYGFYQTWFRFSEVRSKLIRRNRRYGSTTLPFGQLASIWISHWSYKWFTRVIVSFLLLLGGLGLLVSVYLLLLVVVDAWP
jgi:hypothetical protein